MDILVRRLKVDNVKFKTLEDFTHEETNNLHKKFEGR